MKLGDIARIGKLEGPITEVVGDKVRIAGRLWSAKYCTLVRTAAQQEALRTRQYNALLDKGDELRERMARSEARGSTRAAVTHGLRALSAYTQALAIKPEL